MNNIEVGYLWCILLIFYLENAMSQGDSVPEILQYENNNDGLGTYNFFFKTSDGILRSEFGEQTGQGLVVRGSYQYTGPDGKLYTVEYTADETGYHPKLIVGPLPVIPQPVGGFGGPPPAVIASLLG